MQPCPYKLLIINYKFNKMSFWPKEISLWKKNTFERPVYLLDLHNIASNSKHSLNNKNGVKWCKNVIRNNSEILKIIKN